MARRIIQIVAGLVVVVLGAVGVAVAYGFTAWDQPVRGEARALTAPTDAAAIARGAHLYRDALACWTCHGGDGQLQYPSAPQSGGRYFDLSGVGPGFGKIWGSNLTPDLKTGLGGWSDGEIARAVREGVDRDGRKLFPIMESELYNGLSDDDVLALIAYMRTLEPVENAVPAYQPSAVAKLLLTYVIETPPEIIARVEAPPKGVTVAYGKYLSWHVAPCAGCHTPRSQNDGRWDWSRPLAGGIFSIEEPLIGFSGSNLTPHESAGVGAWTEQDFLTAMHTGTRPDGRVLFPAVMPWPSYAHWSDDDLKAVWLYLGTLAPDGNQPPPTTLRSVAAGPPGTPRGEALFEAYCLSCHGPKGSGTPYTDAAMREVATELDDEALRANIEDGIETMPGFAKTLDSAQLDDLTAFIRSFAPFDAGKGPPAAAGEGAL